MKDIINTKLLNDFSAFTPSSIGYTKAGKKHNTYSTTWAEYAACAAINAVASKGLYALPLDALRRGKHISRGMEGELQMEGFDIALYAADPEATKLRGLKTSPKNDLGVDIKFQPKAHRYGSVNVEFSRIVKGRESYKYVWLWDNKASWVGYLVKDKLFTVDIEKLRTWARSHADDRMLNGREAQEADGSWSHDGKTTIRLSLSDLESMAARVDQVPVEWLEFWKAKVESGAIDRNCPHYCSEDFTWLDRCIEEAKGQ